MNNSNFLFENNRVLHTPFCIDNASAHTMGDSLYRYIEMKIHELFEESTFDKIIVRGDYDRVNARISKKEKNDKLFNFHRPTAKIEDKTLYLCCYPSQEYVRHYACLIKTHLNLTCPKKKIPVFYSEPSETDCWNVLLKSNLANAPKSKTAILGYGLDSLAQSPWSGEGPFIFSNCKAACGQITLIGCQHSIWADAGGRVVYQLGKLGFERVIYIGKLGGLKDKFKPNETLATGSRSYLNGEIIEWENIFENIKHPSLLFGDHYNCPSVIYETKRWLKKCAVEHDFVDPEIGHMAKYAKSCGICFSYLHLISDSLCQKYNEDLSNERNTAILAKRHELKNKIIKEIIYSI